MPSLSCSEGNPLLSPGWRYWEGTSWCCTGSRSAAPPGGHIAEKWDTRVFIFLQRYLCYTIQAQPKACTAHATWHAARLLIESSLAAFLRPQACTRRKVPVLALPLPLLLTSVHPQCFHPNNR